MISITEAADAVASNEGGQKRVVYDDGYRPPEVGVVSSVNLSGTVFVKYGTDLHAKGTRCEDLTWVEAR